jgi:hypothetical protein
MKPVARHAESLRIYAGGVGRALLKWISGWRGSCWCCVRRRRAASRAKACGLVFAKHWPERMNDVAHSSPLALLVVRAARERALHPGTPTCALRDMHAWL